MRASTRFIGQDWGPPVRNLLQVHLFVAVQQLRDIVPDDSHEEGDEDDGQDHPQPNTGVQQELGTTHLPPSNLLQADKVTLTGSQLHLSTPTEAAQLRLSGPDKNQK